MNIKLNKILIFFVLICFFNLSLAYARIPHGATVVSGEATFKRVGHHTLDIITNGNTIIDWQNFNLRAGQTIDFIQGSSLSTVLNDILYGPSVIAGNIYSNGGLIFSDAQGIDFTSTVHIRAASLIATSLGISSSDFLSGQYNFEQQGDNVGMVTNEGKILAVDNGFILLLGGAVANSGTMTAKLGTVALASGSKATVTVSNDQLLSVVVDQATQAQITGVSTAVSNTGKINAAGGTVKLTAQTLSNIFDNAINQAGIINATSVLEKNGHVILNGGQQGTVLDTGNINVSGNKAGQTGGTVEILGQDIGLLGKAQINASGANGGGEIHIGRDTSDPNGFEAAETIIDPNVILNASATQDGNGGLIETSGDYLLENSININTLGAGSGHTGTLLMDPWDVDIVSGSTSGGSFSSGIFTPTSSSQVSTTDIEILLATTGVDITTGSSGTEDGNITVESAINQNTTHPLSLNAAGGIAIDANISLGSADLTLTAENGDITEASSAAISTSGTITATANNIYLNGSANNFTGDLNLNSNGNPMALSITNSGYTNQTLSSAINTNAAQLSSFALDLPNYNPNPGSNTSLSNFINSEVLPNVTNSPTFDLSLTLPAYTSALEIGDDSSGDSTNLIDLTQLTSSTPDTAHNLTAETAGNISLLLNEGTATVLSVNNAVLETTKTGGAVSVETQQSDNVMEINGGLTVQTNDNTASITVSGNDPTAQIQTPVLNTTTNGGSITLANFAGVDGSGSYSLNMTENSNAMPDLNFGSGVSTFNDFTLSAPSFNGASSALNDFMNNYILDSFTNSANSNLALYLPSDTFTINIGNGIGGGSLDFSPLNGFIHDLTVHSAGNILFEQNAGSTFEANNIDLESTAGNVSINAVGSNDRIAVSSALTLKATNAGSTININNTGVGEVDTLILNVEGNDSTIDLTNVSSNSSFVFNMTEDSASTLSTVSASNIGKFDSFSLTAATYNSADDTTLTTFLNDQIMNNAALPSSFDLTLNLPDFTPTLVMGAPFSGTYVSFASLNNKLHDLTVSTAGEQELVQTDPLTANTVTMNTTGTDSDLTVSYLHASSSMTLAATGAGDDILVAAVVTPILNTTTNGGSITLDHVTGSSEAGSSFALNMTENSNAMPDLLYGQNADGYTPAFSSFSLTAPNFNQFGTSLYQFVDTSLLAFVSSPSSFNLSLDLSGDTNTIIAGHGSSAYIDFNEINDLTIQSAGEIDLENNSGVAITADQLDLATTGNGSAITVNATSSGNHINFNTLDTTTDGGTVTVNNNSTQAFALNMTENANNTPDLIMGGTGSAPTLSSFSLTAPNFNQTAGALETFVNTLLTDATDAPTFNLTLDLPADSNAIEIGDDTSGTYINLDVSPLNNTIGNVTVKSAGTINFTDNGGGPITANNLDLETTGFASAVNIEAENGGDTINVNSSITAKATGSSAASITTDNGAGQINTPVVNTETNGGSIAVNGISENFAMNITEDSDNTPDLLASLQGSFTSLNVIEPNYNLGNDVSGNVSLTTWFNFIFSNLGVTGGLNLSVNMPSDQHTIQMGYGASGNFIDLSQLNGGTYTGANFGDLFINSAGEIDLIANNYSIVANSVDLETSGILSNVNVITNSGNTITLTSGSTPLTLAATGGGNIIVDNSNLSTVAASAVNTTTTGGIVDLSSVTGGSTGSFSPYVLNMTDDSGLVPILETSAQLSSFSFTAPNLVWDTNEYVENLLNEVLTNEGTGSDFDLTWDTVSLRDELNLANLEISSPVVDNLSLDSFGTINLTSSSVAGNLNVDTSNGAITESIDGIGVAGTTTLTAGEDIDLSLDNGFGFQTVTATANNITINDANGSGLVLGNITASGNISLTAAGGITQTTGDIIDMTSGTAGANTASFNISSGNSGDIVLDNANDFNQDPVSVGGAGTVGSVTLNDIDATGLVLDNITASGDVTITAQNDITQNESTTIASNDATTSNTGINITSTLGNIVQNGTITTGGSQIDMSAKLDLSQNGTITAGSGSNWGNISLFALGTSGGTGMLTQAGTVEGNDLALSATSDASATGALLQNGSLISHDPSSSNTGIGLYQGYGPDITQSEAGTMNTDGSSVFIGNNSINSGENITQEGSINTIGGDVGFSLSGTGTITQYNTGSIAADQVELFLSHSGSVTLDGVNNAFNALAVNNTNANRPTDPISTALNAADHGNLAFGLFYNDPSNPPSSPDSLSSLTLNTTGNITHLTSDDDGDTPETTKVTGPVSFTAGGYIGTLTSPLNIDVTGVLSLTINGELNGDSGVFTGSDTSLQLPTPPPGDIIFNGTVIYPLSTSIDQDVFGSLLGFWGLLNDQKASLSDQWLNLNLDQLLQIPGLPALSLNLQNPGPFQDEINKIEQEIDSAFQP